MANKLREVDEVAKEIVENHYNEDMEMNEYPSAHKLLNTITQTLTADREAVREQTIRAMQHQALNVLQSAEAVAQWGDVYLEANKTE